MPLESNERSLLLPFIIIVITITSIIVFITTISYHRFPLPWYFSSWTSGAPHNSGFNFQIVALSLLHAMSPNTTVFVESLFNAFWCLCQKPFSPLVTITVVPVITGMKKYFTFHIR